MEIAKRLIALVVAAAMIGGCASGGGGGGGGAVTATYSDGSTRELTLAEFVGCLLTLFLFCGKRSDASTSAASGSGGSATTASKSSATQSTSTSAASAAPPTKTWDERRASTSEVNDVYNRLNYNADVSTEQPVMPVSAATSGPNATARVTISESEIVSLETQGHVLTSDGTTLPFRPGLANATGEDASIAGVIANPYQYGWSYQSFGAWNRHSPTGAGIGASSFGESTPATAIPASGTAKFVGSLAGFYVSPGGARTTAAAGVNVAVDFGARSLSFASSGTELSGSGNTLIPVPHLDMNGSMTYSANSGSFSGSFATVGGDMTGGAQGRFYGPAAQELGGVFMVRHTGTSESFVGAYGAKR